MRKKLKTTPEERAAYRMPPPNEDAAAYNWELKSLRKPDPKSLDKRDPDAGESIFRAPQETPKTMARYGHDAQFICPKYLQIMLDSSAAVRQAAANATKARYSKAAMAELQATIMRVFEQEILPDIKKNVAAIGPTLAQFYAARLAHIKKFGAE